MTFTFHTVYDLKALTALSKALRKTLRKKRNLFIRIFGWFCIGLVLLTLIPLDGQKLEINVSTVICWIAALLILLDIFFDDQINGYIAKKTAVSGIKEASTAFHEDGYTSSVTVGTTEWKYESILCIAETKDYFIFMLDKRHGQIYDKSSLSGGTVEEFRQFLTEKTGKPIQAI